MAKPRVGTVWLEGCAGCHMSFLDLDERLLQVLGAVELTVSPITDYKDYDFPELTLGIVEGAIGTTEHQQIARKLRSRCKILIALGDCATFGGINTMRNWIPKQEVLRYGYVETPSTVDGAIPCDKEIPPLLDQVLPLDYLVEVDLYLPGCPPSPEAIAYAITSILEGKTGVLPSAMLHFD